MVLIGWEEYDIEKGQKVDLAKLITGFVKDDAYNSARRTLVRGCHDVMIGYRNEEGEKGLFLVIRDNEPAKGEIWPIGGGMKRGFPTEESLRKIVRGECGLELEENIVHIGGQRVYWDTSSCGNGADEIGEMFFSNGLGQINLDKLHKSPRIVTPKQYEGLRDSLHPYVRNNMDKAMPLLDNNYLARVIGLKRDPRTALLAP